MIDREREISSSTKLTTVAVAAENILSGEDDLLIRDADVDGESHNARKGHRHGDRAEQLAGVSFDQFCLSEKKENNGFLHVTDTHRFVVLVQDQDLTVQPAMNAFRG